MHWLGEIILNKQIEPLSEFIPNNCEKSYLV